MFDLLQQLADWPYFVPALAAISVVSVLYFFSRPGKPPAGVEDSQILPATPLEQRKSARRRGNPIEVLYSPPDRSMGGIRLAVVHNMLVGSILAIRPSNASPVVPWVEVEVRTCQPAKGIDGEFELGCQFVRTPPYSILLLFG
jgi:hypothetical protein